MAIRVLKDHDVPEENIIFLTFLAASAGLHVLSNAFPNIKIVTSMVDPVLSPDTLWIEPGIGNFGGSCSLHLLQLSLHTYILIPSLLIDRYYGTEDD